MSGRLALLAGLFIAPAILLAIGHRLRERSDRAKRAFWGGVIGHIAGMCIACGAMFAPPIWWEGGPGLRDFIVHWAMLVAFLAGGLIGWVTAPAPSASLDPSPSPPATS